MDLEITVTGASQWSYAYAGTRRPVVGLVDVKVGGRLPDVDTPIHPRVSLQFPIPVAEVWEGQSRTVSSTFKADRDETQFQWSRVDLAFDYAVLARLQEHMPGAVLVEIVNSDDGTVLATDTRNLAILAANSWQFEADYCDALAAFVLPSDPYVAEILRKVQVVLERETGSPSLEGYQSEVPVQYDSRPLEERSRAHKIAAAIYEVMSNEPYAYSDPPGNFFAYTQRVRTPSQIKSDNSGTCLDTTVLMAACLAQAGLEPVLFLTEGHAFAGYLTGEHVSAKGYGESAVQLVKNAVKREAGSSVNLVENNDLVSSMLLNNWVQPVETTSTGRGSDTPFHVACQQQNNFTVRDMSSLESIVFVSNAWAEGITPPISLADVPLRGFVHVPGKQSELDVDIPVDMGFSFGADIMLDDASMSAEESARPPRVRQWMSSLLDLSGRNPLLRVNSRSTLEFVVPPSLLGQIDDLLYTPKKKMEIVSPSSLPREWIHEGATDGKFDSWIKANVKLVYPSHSEMNSIQKNAEELLRSIRGNPGDVIPEKFRGPIRKQIEEIRQNSAESGSPVSDNQFLSSQVQGELASLHSQLAAQLKKVGAKASDAMLLTGNNSLHLTLGSVSWTEQSAGWRGSSTTKWCAPLYLYPVILEGGKGSPFTMRLDPNGEVTPNYPLHEKLKRPPYNLDLQELVKPKMDNSGIDFDLMMQAISQRLKQAHLDNFAVEPRVFLGVFDYSTFRLWKDYKDSWQKMTEISPVAHHLILSPNDNFPEISPVSELKLEPYLPISSDDSQRQAVQWALDGKSFRLEGPPGTGKSQTITNLLASFIAHNKKVLFIAEKQTALNAVKERLDDAGLGKYCLNLHAKGDSDTKMRKKISEALTAALNERVDPQDDKWLELSHKIANEEAALDRYRQGLHELTFGGVTAWEAHEQLTALGERPIFDLSGSFVENFETNWPLLLSAVSEIDAALEVVGDPAKHVWRMVTDVKVGSERYQTITDSVTEILSVLDADGGDDLALFIDRFGIQNTAVLAELVSLHELGDLPSSAFLESLVPVARRSESSAPDTFERFINSCSELSKELETHFRDVSPSILIRDDIDDLERMVEEIRATGDNPQLLSALMAWSDLASDFEPLRTVISDEILAVTGRSDVVKALAQARDNTFLQQIDDLVLGFRAVSLEAAKHSTNLRLEFLIRNDLVNVRHLANEASGAGMLTRGKKYKVLRELLGSDVLTNDNDMLANSLNSMLDLGDNVSALLATAQLRYEHDLPTPFRPWDPGDIRTFEDNVRGKRVDVVRAIAAVTTSPANNEEFLSAVEKALQLASRADECTAMAAGIIGSVDPKSLRPWIGGEADRLQSLLRQDLTATLRTRLGTDALSEDDSEIVAAATAILGARLRISELTSAEMPRALPSYSGQFEVWNGDDISNLKMLRDRLVDLFGGDDDHVMMGFAKDVLDGRALPPLQGANELARAWSAMTDALDTDDRSIDAWKGDRTFMEAVREDFPRMRDDAGERNRYLELERWKDLLKAVGTLERIGIGDRKWSILSGETQIDLFASDARRSALSLAFEHLMTSGGLDRFDRKRHEQRIANFERVLGEARAIMPQRISGLVNRRMAEKAGPIGADVGATAALLKGLKPGRGDKTPIRDLVSRYGKSLADAMPCFLMSPDSVATLIPVGAIDFDLVIFDEASQIRTSHAVGALGRGKAGVVVGDQQQMPPSNAFSSNTGVYDDGEFKADLDVEVDGDGPIASPITAQDSESILAEFDACNFPHMQLLCHYRSRDEVLISFSNANIYDKPMLTFPSTKGLQSDALRYVLVKEGHFERSKDAPPHVFGNTGTKVPSLRTNLPETMKVVEFVLSRLRDPERNARLAKDPEGKCESIIIVTFNSQQKTLIEEMLRDADETLYEVVTKETPGDDDAGIKPRPPRVKIRNLESVQGDEAETVIFSVAFSKDSSGKFPVNFGPVTQSGGERRLNVAVTRAQKEMVVFASFIPSDMAGAGRKLSNEAQMVQRFLHLAHNGAGQVGDVGIAVPRSAHIEQIGAALHKRGYETQTQLGLSTLRVDIAVRRPGDLEWSLAIMVDDTCWSDRGSSYQRELLPRQILPGLGWGKVLRFWLPSWLDERAGLLDEVDRFFSGIEEPESELEPDEFMAVQGGESETGTIVPREDHLSSAPSMINPNRDRLTEFVAFTVSDMGPMDLLDRAATDAHARADLMAIVNQILTAEAPIEAERFGKLVCRCLKFGRVSPERVEQVFSLIPSGQTTQDVIGRFVWHADQDPTTWDGFRTSSQADRQSHEISVAEYSNALADLVSKDPPVARDDATRAIASVFGWQKVAKLIKGNIDIALREAVRSGRVTQTGEDLFPVKS